MPRSLKEIAGIALATLTAEERRRGAVYLDPHLLERGASVSIRSTTVPVTVASLMAFVDLQPGANWGHPCRYLLVSREDGSIARVDSQFPPSTESLRIVHRGEGVEDWMLLSTQPLEDKSS
jgi:hypothetical protein